MIKRRIYLTAVLLTALILLVATVAYAGGKKNGEKGRSVKAEGEITALSATSITVAGVTFAITEETKVTRGTFDDLAVGKEVKVKGRKLDDDSIEALQIQILGEKPKVRKKMIMGVVTAITRDGEGNVTSFTIDDESEITTASDLKLKGRHGLPATVNNLVEGMSVRVRYNPTSPASVETALGEAKSVVVVGKTTIKGKIGETTTSAVTLPFILVNTFTIYYDEITVVIGASGGVDDPGDLPAGTPVQVLCNPLVDGTFIANKVVVNNSAQGGKPVKDAGIVTGVATEGGEVISFDVDGTTYTVGENTEFKVAGYDGPFPEELFVVGLHVVVKAQPTLEDALLALWVRVVLPIYKYCGEIEAVGTDSLTLLGLQIFVTEYTEFKDFAVPAATLADLDVGDKVDVKAILWPDGTLIASEIKPCDDDDVHILGEIESITPTAAGATLVVAGVTVLVDAATDIYDKAGALTLADLAVGDTVDVWGALDATGNLLADRIRLR
jgi:hypothetical protein